MRKHYLSAIRIASCFAIVLLHALNVAEILYRGTLSAQYDTVSLAVLNCLRFAVPCFVMVTGALLLDPEKELPVRKIYGKYLLRILLALLVFTYIYRIFSMVMNGEAFSAQVLLDPLPKLWAGGGWAHLWYLYVLIGLYLLLPFYRMIAKAAGRRELLLLLFVYLLFVSVLPAVQLLTGSESGFSIPVTTIYPFYLFAGYVLDRGYLRIKKGAAVLLAGASCALLVFFTFRNTENQFGSALLSYSSILVVVLAVSVFSLFLPQAGKPAAGAHSAAKPVLCPAILRALDTSTFGIYLIHMIFLRLFLRYRQWNPYGSGSVFLCILEIAGITLLTFALSFLITTLLKKIPGIRKIL